MGPGGVSVSPVRPTAAPPHGWYGRGLAAVVSSSFTAWVNLAGTALAVPVGFTHDGLPLGVQLVGAAGSEATLLDAGLVLERALSPGMEAPPPLAVAS